MSRRLFDVAAVRRQVPILAGPPGGTPLHYLDNSATSQVPQPVLDALVRHETTSRANVLRGVHRLAEAATAAYEDARAELARYVGAAAPEEIVFTSGTTGAINLVARSLGETLHIGDEIVLSALEHHSNLVPWQMLRDRAGVILRFLPVTAEGRIDTDALERTVTPSTKLIAVASQSGLRMTMSRRAGSYW